MVNQTRQRTGWSELFVLLLILRSRSSALRVQLTDTPRDEKHGRCLSFAVFAIYLNSDWIITGTLTWRLAGVGDYDLDVWSSE